MKTNGWIRGMRYGNKVKVKLKNHNAFKAGESSYFLSQNSENN